MPVFHPVAPQQPIITFFNPNRRDLGLVEIWSTERITDVPIDIGTPHPNTREYPGYRLGLQAAIPTDDGWWKRVWVTDETNPDWFNYEIKFAAEADAFPTFIRQYRIDKKDYAPLTKGIPLSSVYLLKLLTPGSAYTVGTFPAVTFSGGGGSGAIGHAIVNLDGTIADVVLDDGGTGYTSAPTAAVDPPPIGLTATAQAFIQPQTAVLIAEQAEEFPKDSEFFGLFFNVTRVYETLPGPTLDSTRLDDDGIVVDLAHTRDVATSVASSEVINAGNWIKTTKKETGNLYVAERVVETRALPGNPMVSEKPDEDGKIITTTKILKDASTITEIEEIDTGVWRRVSSEAVSDLVSTEITIERDVPGNPMVDIKMDKDGIQRGIVKTLKDTTTITEEEVISSGVWITVEKEAVSDLVATEIVTGRLVPGNNVPSASVGGDHEISNINTILRDGSTITPSATEAGGFITTVEKKDVTDLVANEVTTVKEFLDEASYAISIPNLIPEWARAQIPTIIESHILAGTAAPPTLASGEFSASEKQLTKLLYERRVEKIASTSLPITATNQETTEEYGGGILNVTVTLDDSALTVDEGLLVVSSETKTLAVYTGSPPGLFMKETKELDDTAWPLISSRLWDDNMRLEFDETRQVVDAGTAEDPDPGGSVFAWVSEVKSIDKWRSWKINSSKPSPTYVDKTTALITYKMEPFRFPGYLRYSGTGYYTRGATAVLVLHTIRTWWVKSFSTPTVGATGSGADVEFDEIVTDDVVINNLSNTGFEYARNVLHDGFTFGTLVFPPTTPTATEYAQGSVTGSTVLDIIGLFAYGSGYVLGDVLNIAGDGGSANVTLTAIGIGGSVFGFTPNSGTFGWTPAGSYGPYTATGGAGSGAEFYVIAADVPTYDPGSKWIGNEHVIGASVTPEKEPNIFKIQTESIIMR